MSAMGEMFGGMARQLVTALLAHAPPEVREARERFIAEERWKVQIRDYVRHRWREETGQIPRGSGMETSWNEARYRR